MKEPININEASFDKAVLQSPVPVLVDFWAPWCGPCKMIAPVLDEIAREKGDAVRVAKVNVDDEGGLAQRFGVRGIPALLFFSGGELRHQVAGVRSKKELVDQLEALSGQTSTLK
jgi:thioredoxin 1